MSFYAYLHARPSADSVGGVFYVGKGKGSRYKDLTPRNRWHGFVVKKHGRKSILTSKIDCSSEEIAFELERGLIKCLRRTGVELTNQTDGGDGSAGYTHTDSAKKLIGEASRSVGLRPEVIQSRSEATKRENAKRWADPEYRKRVSAAMRGKRKTMTPASLISRRENIKKAQAVANNKNKEK